MSLSDQLANWKLLVAGGLAGAVSRTITSPVERTKILFQLTSSKVGSAHLNSAYAQANHSTLATLLHMYRHEGLLGFFRGNGVNVMRMFPYTAAQFVAFENTKRVFIGSDGVGKFVNAGLGRFVSGMIAGCVASALTYPLDLVRTRLTADVNKVEFNGVADCLVKLYKSHGIKGWFQGLSPTLMGISVFAGVNFYTFDAVKRFLITERNAAFVPIFRPVEHSENQEGAPSGSSAAPAKKLPPLRFEGALVFLTGSISGLFASTIAYPFELARRRLQMPDVDASYPRYTSTTLTPMALIRKIRFLDMILYVYQHEKGIRGLYRGMVPCWLKVVPAQALSFTVYEETVKLLNADQGRR